MDTIMVGLSAMLFCLGTLWELRLMRRRLAAVERVVCAMTDAGVCEQCRRYVIAGPHDWRERA